MKLKELQAQFEKAKTTFRRADDPSLESIRKKMEQLQAEHESGQPGIDLQGRLAVHEAQHRLQAAKSTLATIRFERIEAEIYRDRARRHLQRLRQGRGDRVETSDAFERRVRQVEENVERVFDLIKLFRKGHPFSDAERNDLGRR